MEHIETRNLTPYEFAALMVIILSADKANGVWWGSDKALSGKFGYAYPETTAKTSLRSLRDKGYLKMFRNQGETGNAPYLVNRYEITVGDLTGYLINADATMDWKNPVCFHLPDDVPAHVPEGVPARIPLSRPTRPQDLDTSISQDQRNTKSYVVEKSAKQKNLQVDSAAIEKSIQQATADIAEDLSADTRTGEVRAASVGRAPRKDAKVRKPQSTKIVKISPMPSGPEISAEDWRTGAGLVSEIKSAIVTFEDGKQAVAQVSADRTLTTRQGVTLTL